jgi:hypothetical protein
MTQAVPSGTGMATASSVAARLSGCLVVAVALATGCGGSSTVMQNRTPELRAFHSKLLSFRYPVSWKAHRYRNQSEFSTAIVYLSNDRLHPPCRHPRPGFIHCGAPLKRLHPRGVLVEWSENGFPGWTFKDAHGKPMRVDGLHAKLATDRRAGCEGLGGDHGLVLTVERPHAADNWYELRACTAGPLAAATEAQVRALIASTNFTAP